MDKRIKICSECGKKKKLEKFHRTKYTKDGRAGICAVCCSIRQKIYRQNNSVKLARKKREWYLNNIESRAKYNKEWKQKNKIEQNEKNRLYMKNRRIVDPQYRLRMNLANRIRMALKRKKSLFTYELIGCSIEELKQYLELQFKNRMSWKNYGVHGWQIDHIRPCASFDLTDVRQQKICFNYKNLQPLWAKENNIKGVKVA